MNPEEPLENWKHEQFACQVATGIPARAAYVNAGYKDTKSAEASASILQRTPKVAARISHLKKTYAAAQAEEVKVDDVWLTRQYLTVATADPNELIRVKTGACRYCHGANGEYHWRNRDEFARHHRTWAMLPPEKQATREEPNDLGGYGYSLHLPINPDCGNCDGLGTSRVAVADTAKASPAARRLLATIKQTRDGVEIKVHDQMHALDQLGRIIGAFEKDNKQKGEGAADALMAAILERTKAAGSKIPFATAQPEDKPE